MKSLTMGQSASEFCRKFIGMASRSIRRIEMARSLYLKSSRDTFLFDEFRNRTESRETITLLYLAKRTESFKVKIFPTSGAYAFPDIFLLRLERFEKIKYNKIYSKI